MVGMLDIEGMLEIDGETLGAILTEGMLEMVGSIEGLGVGRFVGRGLDVG